MFSMGLLFCFLFGGGRRGIWGEQKQLRPGFFMDNKDKSRHENHMYMDVPDRKLGSMVRINGLFHLLITRVYWGYNPLILTIDPNFQRDIQVYIIWIPAT